VELQVATTNDERVGQTEATRDPDTGPLVQVGFADLGAKHCGLAAGTPQAAPNIFSQPHPRPCLFVRRTNYEVLQSHQRQAV
jgi:hypothetical protein